MIARRAILPTVIAALAAPETLYAQSASERALEEVVVTARKREESLQETPVAVTALNGDALRAAQIGNMEDLVKNVPGLTAREGRKEGSFTIRGVGVRADDLQLDPGVGIYVDGVFIPRTDSQIVDVINAQSVQVLRGPQGTLFGKNTAGGAMLMTSKKPAMELEGFVEGTVGTLGRKDLSVGVSGPIIDDVLAGGLVLDLRRQDGYREDAETGRGYGDVDRQALLGQLHWLAGDSATIDLFAFHGEINENAAPATCRLANTAAGLQLFIAPGETRRYADLCEMSESLNDDEKVLMDRIQNVYEITSTMAGMTVQWDIGELSFKSVTGYLTQKGIQTDGDSDASPTLTLTNESEPKRHWLANGINPDAQRRKFLSQEFNVSGSLFDEKVDFTAGVFASKENIDDVAYALALGPGGVIGIPLAPENILVLGAVRGLRDPSVQNFENTSWAVFGQAIYSFNDNWQLTFGARYTEETKNYEQANYIASTVTEIAGFYNSADFHALENFTHTVVPTGDVLQREETWSEVSPAVTLSMFIPDSWQGDVFSDGMFYLSASKGFKAGGFSSFGDELLPFDPEVLTAYELGFKLDLFDRHVRLNGAIYQSEYEEIQLTAVRETGFDPSTGVRSFANGITNAADATIRGAELEFTWLASADLMLGLTASYIDAQYNEFMDISQVQGVAQEFDRSGEDFSYLPRETYSWFAQYSLHTDFATITPRLSGAYKGEIYMGTDVEAVENPVSYLEGYTVWNLRVAVEPQAVDGLELALSVNNLLDEDYFASGGISVNGIGSAFLVPGKQRTIAAQLRYEF